MPMLYLDHAATTPCDPLVLEAMRPYFCEQFGNASSPHAFGRRARKAIEDGREQLAALLGAQPAEIVWTSGGTEANNHAVLGVARACHTRGRHMVVSAIEHHSILEPVKQLSAEGHAITWVAPGSNGLVPPERVAEALRPDTILVAIGHANNEIGSLQNIPAISRLVRERGVCLLVDAVQTVGHISVHVDELGCDLLSLSGHKFYGPPGVGALYLRKGTSCAPLLLGGDQERGRRAGTPNVPGIVGVGKAAELARSGMEHEAARQSSLRDVLIDAVLGEIGGSSVNGDRICRLPNNAHFSFEGMSGEDLVAALDMAGISCSVGSACTSGQMTPSHVLRAIGRSDALALGSLRVTLGRQTTPSDVQFFVGQLKTKINQLRSG